MLSTSGQTGGISGQQVGRAAGQVTGHNLPDGSAAGQDTGHDQLGRDTWP